MIKKLPFYFSFSLIIFAYHNFCNAQKIAAGGYHTLSICNDNVIRTSGRNDLGQLGTDDPGFSSTPVPVKLSNIVAVDAGESHSLALKDDS
ncbi:MAG TPA: hypothetical protein VF691_19470, partial [Cytophagaceae bacterium]